MREAAEAVAEAAVAEANAGKQAAADAAMCISLKPEFSKGYVRLALAQKKQGHIDEAVKVRQGSHVL